jgi:hypothetical protein
MKCPRCKCDPVPIMVGSMRIKPCGLLKDNDHVYGLDIAGCPMSAWQDGYSAALENGASLKRKPATKRPKKRGAE